MVATEAGADFSAFPGAGNFCSWLRLRPDNKVGSSEILSRKTKKGKHRLAVALRNAAQTLHGSQSSLGDYYRQMKAKFGPAKATTAAAHKLARTIYAMVTKHQEFDPSVVAKQDEKQQRKTENRVRRQALAIGHQLVPLQVRPSLTRTIPVIVFFRRRKENKAVDVSLRL